MKDQADRRMAFFLRFLVVFALAGVVIYFAADLLSETRLYLENERIPVMLPGGGAKF
jgi:hypothetical protein